MLLRFPLRQMYPMYANDLLALTDEAPAALRLVPVPAHAGPKEDDPGKGGDGKGSTETGTITKTRPKTKRPNLYRVLLLNDDYTPMEFVVLVLQDVFNKSREDAMQIMLHVHQKGVGECGVYPYEVAETKVTRVMDTARKNQHPLQCVMEKQ
ncbi:ATP-dependent Clp protease adapter ClpS [Devosia sp.]|uniref:ATP-dependent Clp protease adapter ClpS n=1 Tax=Devosia sp. TaxID=1871048 RepID=UPI0025BA62F8|nr:ATP-dependent Clp protease adapter ClpS [Devosia sp.]